MGNIKRSASEQDHFPHGRERLRNLISISYNSNKFFFDRAGKQIDRCSVKNNLDNFVITLLHI